MTGVVVVSDTSPVRALYHVSQVALLHDLYGAVIVPPAVEFELVNPRGPFPSIDVRTFHFMKIRAPTDQERVTRLRASLDPGEAEVIALSIELRATTLVIDEHAGRMMACSSGILVVGVLGVLTRAKEARLIPAVRPLVDTLRQHFRFRVSDTFYRQYLKSIGE